MARQVPILAVLALLALVTWWFAEFNSEKTRPALRRAENSPDSFSKGVTKTVMDETGKVKNRLVAKSMAHYDNDTTELDQPVMTMYENDAPPWVIKSDTGTVLQNGKEVVLNGKVYIDREAAKGIRSVNVFTTNLRVLPESEYAETEDHVEIVSPPDRISGTGMRFYFTRPIKLTLLSKVRGTYAVR